MAYKNFTINKNLTIFLIISFGIFLRLVFANYGFTYDQQINKLNLDIYLLNGSIYDAGTYNYSPFGWINIQYLLNKIPLILSSDEFLNFHYKIVLFLSFIDACIFYLLNKKYSLKISLLFYLNPISIYISGFHGAFDNIAVLISFIGILLYVHKNYSPIGFFYLVITLGISLCIKHIMIFFCIWLAFKEKTLTRKILSIIIPVGIFLLSFINYFPEYFNDILNSVFKYDSLNNYPFWSIFTPQFLYNYIGTRNLYFLTIIILGLVFEKKNILEIYYLYLICLVAFSSSVANQYLAIPLIAIAIFWNKYYLFFTIFSFLFFLLDFNGLNVSYFQELMHWSPKKDRIAYKIIIFFLTVGLLENVIGKKALNDFISNIYNFFKEKIKSQLKL